MRGNIDIDFLHYRDGHGMNITGGVGARAGDREQVSGGSAQQAFGEVTAAGVARAEDENGWLDGWHGEKSAATAGAHAPRGGYTEFLREAIGVL